MWAAEGRGGRGGGGGIWIGGEEWGRGGEGSGSARVHARVRERLHWVGSTDGLMYGWSDGQMFATSSIHATTDSTNQNSAYILL